MLHYSDIFKISNYKIKMDKISKIREVNDKITELKILLEDFMNLHQAKKSKIRNLEKEIKGMKQNISLYLDELESLIDQK